MTKAELIEKMAKDAKISKVAAGAVLESFMGNVTKALKKRNAKVTLVGFGTFRKVEKYTERPARAEIHRRVERLKLRAGML
jgi:DNA-binding protein HU-beta